MKKHRITFTRDERLIVFNALRFAVQDCAELTTNYTQQQLQKRSIRLAQAAIFDRMDWAWHRNHAVKYSLPVSDIAFMICAVLEVEGVLNLDQVSFDQFRQKIAEMFKTINAPYYE